MVGEQDEFRLDSSVARTNQSRPIRGQVHHVYEYLQPDVPGAWKRKLTHTGQYLVYACTFQNQLSLLVSCLSISDSSCMHIYTYMSIII